MRAALGAGRAVVGVVVIAGCTLAGCTLSPAAPSISGVTPNWGYNGEPTEIEIEGAHFFPSVIVGGELGASNDDGGRIEGTFQAWLVGEDESFALDGVQHLSYDRIGAEVPEGLPVGTYGLQVEVPSGLVASVADAFTVTDTRADHLVLSVVTPAYTVGAFAPVTIRLLDPEDHIVAQGMEVRLVATSESTGATGVTFYADGGLEDQQPLNDEVGVTGRLGNDGEGVVLISSDVADDVLIEVFPVEPDAVVRGDRLFLAWKTGPVASVELALPEEGFSARAGEAFDLTVRLKDTFGNVLTTEPADLILFDECGGWVRPISIVGEGTVEVELTAACAEDRIHAYAYATDWKSDPFAVLPGDHAGYEVQAVPRVVTAGGDLIVFVEAVDDWGNVVTTHAEPVALYDDLGGLDPGMGRGEQSCPGFTAGAQVCSASVWIAGPAVEIRAEGSGREGTAEPIEVLPDDAVTLLLDIGASTVAAGERFDATVRVIDRFGNSVGFDPGGTDPVVFLEGSDPIACTWTGAVAGAQRFSCYIEGAVPDARIEAHVLGLTGIAVDPLEVTNAELAEVEVDPQGITFVAGDAFTVSLRGVDAYGNPYVVQSDPTVDLSDTAGTMTPASAVLGPDGEVQVSSVLYGAGPAVRIFASQAGVRLGASRPLLVAPDEQDALLVDAPRWVSVDTDASVEVTAVDAYGNAIPDYAGTVTLSAVGGACDTVIVDAFYDGSATVDLPCTTPQLSEELEAVDDLGFDGRSGVLDVVDLYCPDGPTADLSLDGGEDSIRCLADGGTVSVEADSSGSFGGGTGITVRHYSDGTSVTRTPADSATFTYDTTGSHYVELLVADTRACADVDGGTIYVGSDDGEPTGPVTVTTAASTASSVGSVTVTVTAEDCTSDLAAGKELLVRADLGTPEGTMTGEGIAVTLDAAGAATFLWEFETGQMGTATVYAGSAGGGAVGSRSVAVTGDRVLPSVVEVEPSGLALGTVTTIDVTFSETMLPSTATATNLTLTGPDGVVAATYDWTTDLTTLRITPNVPLDGAAGVYTLVVSKNLRDLEEGNQLDGEWSGVRAPATFTFGAVEVSLPEISSCGASVASFTPDGDDGTDVEADSVALAPTATGTPAWWWLSVYARDGTRVRSLREPGSDPTLSWDGRGNDGILRDSGSYRLSVAPIDTNGNVGGQCDVAVDLQQHVERP